MSKRVRRSRFIEIDGHRVLKLNNYTMEEGERSVFEQESTAMERGLPALKNAYQLFCSEHTLEDGGADEGSTLQRFAAAWRALGAKGKRPYQTKAKKLKEQRAASRELARTAEGESVAAETARLRAAQEADDARRREATREQERQKKTRNKRAREKKKAPVPTAVANSVEGKRQAHNRALKAAAPEAERKRMRFFGGIAKVIKPFVPAKAMRKVPKLSKDELVDFEAARVDTDGAPSIAQPAGIVGGVMRRYQLVGLEWLLSMYDNGMHPILADEMGLGKTLQTISFLAALRERGIDGPHLVVVPLSVMSSWMGEFRRWCPELRVVRLHSQDKVERARLRKEVLADVSAFDVCVTTYEYIKVPEMQHALQSRITWRVLVLDEGHKLKNDLSGVSIAMRRVRAECVLLLTGTPLQNNMQELWALLNFLYRSVFTEVDAFDSVFELSGAEIVIERSVLEAAHHMMRPLMLRRMKSEVEKLLPPKVETQIECPLAPMQLFWYKRLLLKNSAMLQKMEARFSGNTAGAEAALGVAAVGADAGSEWKKLNSLMAQLRKCCNHPFLFPNAEAAMDTALGARGGAAAESIVTASGKMQILDRMLKRLKAKGHRVVIFSQFTRMLDIVDDYLSLRGYGYCRLDGNTNRVQRMVHIQEFNKLDSPYFAFIMSTRAGGMGINLQTADTVILLDSDWNPQVDMQAMARVHRIGQTKLVHIYRFVSKGTMEVRIVQRAQKKLFLDKMVNRDSTATANKMESLGAKEIMKMLSFGMDRIFENSDTSDGGDGYMTEMEVDAIIDRTPRAESSSAAASASASSSAAPASAAASSLKTGQKTNAEEFHETAPMIALTKFQGVDYRKGQEKKSFRGIAEDWVDELKDSDKGRTRVSRFTTVDGHTVLKKNMYTMEDGEPSVFESEAAASSASIDGASYVPVSSRQRAGRDYEHESTCLVCWDGGDLVCCDGCPASYHLGCIGLRPSDLDDMKFQWYCPHHSCNECGRKAGAVGGLIFRCEMCPKAFCEDHLTDFARDHITNKCKRFLGQGQHHPKQACFVLCSNRCAGFSNITAGGRDMDTLMDATPETRESMLAIAAVAAEKDTDELQRNKRRAAEKHRAAQLALLQRATAKAAKAAASSAAAAPASKSGGTPRSKRKASSTPSSSSASQKKSRVSTSPSQWCVKGCTVRVEFKGDHFDAVVEKVNGGKSRSVKVRYADQSFETLEWSDFVTRVALRDDTGPMNVKGTRSPSKTKKKKKKGGGDASAMEEEGEESGDGDDDEDADDKDDADLADLRELYTETIGKSARGALANDAARLAKAIVAKQEADAAEKERIEEERTAKYDAAADARKWDRMAINSATAKNAMQRRVAVLLETGVAPLCLRGVPGVSSRVEAMDHQSLDYLHTLLFGQAPGPLGMAQEILAWEGVGADVVEASASGGSGDSGGAGGAEKTAPCARESVCAAVRLPADAKVRAARLFLRFVRQMQAQKKEGGLYKKVCESIVNALGLKIESKGSAVNRPLSNMSIIKFSECLAAYLTFPAGGNAQVFRHKEIDDDYYDADLFDEFGVRKFSRYGTELPWTLGYDPATRLPAASRLRIEENLRTSSAYCRLIPPGMPSDVVTRYRASQTLSRHERVAEAATESARREYGTYETWAAGLEIPVLALHGWWEWVSKGCLDSQLPQGIDALAAGMAIATQFLESHRTEWRYREAHRTASIHNSAEVVYPPTPTAGQPYKNNMAALERLSTPSGSTDTNAEHAGLYRDHLERIRSTFNVDLESHITAAINLDEKMSAMRIEMKQELQKEELKGCLQSIAIKNEQWRLEERSSFVVSPGGLIRIATSDDGIREATGLASELANEIMRYRDALLQGHEALRERDAEAKAARERAAREAAELPARERMRMLSFFWKSYQLEAYHPFAISYGRGSCAGQSEIVWREDIPKGGNKTRHFSLVELCGDEFGWNHPVGFEGDAAGPRSAGAPAGSEVEKAIAGYIEKLGLRSDVGWYIGINSRRVAAIMCSTPSDTGFEKWWTAEATAARAAEMEMEEE